MNDKKNLSRRRFLQSTGSMGSAAYLRLLGSGFIAITEAACTAKQEASPFKILGAEEASDFAAIAARITTEAGVIHFFDNAFAAEMSSQLDVARTGLAAFNAALEDAHPDRGRFGDLGEDDQDAFLRSQESGEFFSLAWTMTVFGGGNEGHIGWELIGFEGHHGGWQYPFGYYDAEVHGETNHGE
jgi:hypothetical protein